MEKRPVDIGAWEETDLLCSRVSYFNVAVITSHNTDTTLTQMMNESIINLIRYHSITIASTRSNNRAKR